MLNLAALKEKERLRRLEKQEEAKRKLARRPSAAQARIAKDVSELDLPSTCQTVFPNPDDLMNFKVIISPDEGLYRRGRFVFNFSVGSTYPHEPPSVKCVTPVFHPNIDPEGNVCLNILREEWNPVLSLNSVVLGLQMLFLEPNTDEPLNKQAAQMLLDDQQHFGQYVQHLISDALRQSGAHSYR
ncbi:hypothetical protein HPB50_026186 [Hyalomma asiaticum]|uniref:Uncharacterized protein n=1 Tax=Hyalomma asiaticum TaxID=266040 RepID=A0ACB7RM73_HYAAI|nr:hypothetical protein HPB50_026186 [Hyalomma asiaticum]